VGKRGTAARERGGGGSDAIGGRQQRGRHGEPGSGVAVHADSSRIATRVGSLVSHFGPSEGALRRR